MPQVPYQPFPDVAPQVNPTGKIGLSVPSEAFGANVGQAIEGAGKEIEKVSDTASKNILDAQNLRNEAATRDAAADFMIDIGERHAKYSALQGKDAAEGYGDYVKGIKDSFKTYRGTLPNPAAQRMFDSFAQSTMSRTIFNGAGHAATQQKIWTVDSLDAQSKAVMAGVTLDTSDGAFDRASGQIEGLSRRKGEALGRGEDWIKEDAREKIQTMVSSRLTTMARVDPFGAREAFTRNKETLDEPTANRVENAINVGEASKGAASIVSKVTEGLTPETTSGALATMVEAGQKQAEALSPGNDALAKNIEAGVIGKYNRLQAVERDNTRGQEKIVGDWVHENNIKDRGLVTSDPAVYDAFTKLSPSAQQKYLNQIDYNAKMDANLPTDARKANYERLSGMPGGGQVKDFNNIDLNLQDLTKDQRKTLQQTQNKSRKGEAVDPHVTRVLHDPNVQSMLMSEDILTYEGKPANFEQYNRLSGMIKGEIENYFEQNGKWPKPEEEHAMAAKVIRMQATYPTWFGLSTGKKSIFKEGIPDTIRTKIIGALKDEGIEEPTEEDVIRRVMKLRGGDK